MTKLLFVQKSGLPWHGVMALSAILRGAGVETDLVLADEDNPVDRIREYQPDFVGFHVVTGEQPWVLSLCRTIGSDFPRTRTVLGGPHATSRPMELAKDADYVLQGEADVSILGVLSQPDKGVTPPPPLVQDLSSLPTPDRDLYYRRYSHLAKSTVKQFLTGRGCPFSCSFCQNHLLRRMYQGQKWTRRRTPEDVTAELVDVKSRWGFKTISFSDDVFTLDRVWLTRFLGMYSREVRSPFMCNIRCDMVNRDVVAELKEAGCYGLEMGVESGSERIRREVMNKGEATNERIIEAGRVVKGAGLMLKTFNIIGSPTETLEDCFATVKLNEKMRPDHASCTFLVPYPEYDITERYFKDAVVEIGDSYLEPPKWVDRQTINLQTFFFILVKMPFLMRAVKRLMRFPPNQLYRTMALLFYGAFMARCHRLTLGDIIRYCAHIRPGRL